MQWGMLRKEKAFRGKGENTRTIVTDPSVYPLHRNAADADSARSTLFPPFLFFLPLSSPLPFLPGFDENSQAERSRQPQERELVSLLAVLRDG